MIQKAHSTNCCFLALDIGGTSIKHGLVTSGGQLLNKGKVSLAGCDEGRFDKLLLQLSEQAAQLGACGAGVSCLGVVNSHTGHILDGVQNLPFLKGKNLPALLQTIFSGSSVHIQNDVNCMALGELWKGAGQGCQNLLCVAPGAGIGGAVVVGGQLVEGTHFRAGEIGYWDYANEEDYYERSWSTEGFLDGFAKSTGLPRLDGPAFFAAVRQEEEPHQSALSHWMERLGRLIANGVLFFDPDKVIVGGGVSQQADVLLPLLRKAVDSHLPIAFRGQTKVVAAENHNDSALLGAVYLHIKK